MSLNVEKTTWHKKYPFQNNMPMYIYFFLLAKKMNKQTKRKYEKLGLQASMYIFF